MELYERIIPREVMDGPRPADATDAADPSERPFANAWRFIGLYTRTPITIRPVNTQPGDQASYRGRWVTARGEPAAFGNVISLRLPFTSAPRVSACMPRDRRAAA
jgi:hypothetical protein